MEPNENENEEKNEQQQPAPDPGNSGPEAWTEDLTEDELAEVTRRLKEGDA